MRAGRLKARMRMYAGHIERMYAHACGQIEGTYAHACRAHDVLYNVCMLICMCFLS
jgi:hypothetical protein